jgi:hypothetical protein
VGLRVSALAFVAFVAVGCGSSAGPHVPHDDVAVVGSVRISQASYDALLARFRAQVTRRLGALSKGESATLESAVMTRLVTDAEQTNRAAARAGVEARSHVEPADRASFVGFVGDGTPRAREIRYLVLDRRDLARALYVRAVVGDDRTWCTIAHRSLDHGSRDRCGTSLITNGMLERPLNRLAFTTPIGTTILVQASNLYWVVLEPLSTVETGGADAQVDKLLLVQRRAIDVGVWEGRIAKRFCKGINVGYRKGYEPDPNRAACAPPAKKE